MPCGTRDAGTVRRSWNNVGFLVPRAWGWRCAVRWAGALKFYYEPNVKYRISSLNVYSDFTLRFCLYTVGLPRWRCVIL